LSASIDSRIAGLAVSTAPHLSTQQIEAGMSASYFVRWAAGLMENFTVDAIHVRDVVMFGSRAGFVLAEAEVKDAEGRKLPGVAFLRGDAVAVLLTLDDVDGKPLVILTRQARTVVGSKDFYEIPAGMLDGGEFSSKALEEISEEIGADIVLREEDLEQIAECHTTPGACDEKIRIYVSKLKNVDAATIASLKGRKTGNAHENEAIVVAAVSPQEALSLVSADMKSLVALRYFIDGSVGA
jgi:ADP-sugar diphosphatase